ncbi:uncharacterized protein LOC141912076 [Tubulanus polymorphus]|uniref:uncharacterized protein LOC141912076 n=1 Tax=Tubulanus polymorphus TaxID=672921 RepID=UPI003DA56CB9
MQQLQESEDDDVIFVKRVNSSPLTDQKPAICYNGLISTLASMTAANSNNSSEGGGIPIGQSFVAPMTGFYCQLCRRFFTSRNTAEIDHCSTSGHRDKYKQYLKSQRVNNKQQSSRRGMSSSIAAPPGFGYRNSSTDLTEMRRRVVAADGVARWSPIRVDDENRPPRSKWTNKTFEADGRDDHRGGGRNRNRKKFRHRRWRSSFT